MKREYDIPSNKPLILHRFLVVIFITVVALLAAGSLFAIIRAPDSAPLFRLGRLSQIKDPAVKKSGGGDTANSREVATFSGIGRLRIPASGQPEATVIISISFPYPADDHPFTEELAAHVSDFRSVARGYFSSLPREKIIKLDENAAKTELLKRFNAILRLGKIETLYFTDYNVIE